MIFAKVQDKKYAADGQNCGFLMDNVSNLSSARNITNTLGSMQEKIHHTTVGNYMQYLCNAFAFYKVRRYDIKGKSIYRATTNTI